MLRGFDVAERDSDFRRANQTSLSANKKRSDWIPGRSRPTSALGIHSALRAPFRVIGWPRSSGYAGPSTNALSFSAYCYRAAIVVRIPLSPPKKSRRDTRLTATHPNSWDSLRAARSVPRHRLRTDLPLRGTGCERSRVLRLVLSARRCRSNPSLSAKKRAAETPG